MRALGLALLLAAASAGAEPPRPDYLVAQVIYQAPNLVVEVQNQGPGLGSGTLPVRVELENPRRVFLVQVSAPREEFALARTAPIEVGASPSYVRVELDPSRSLAEENLANNQYGYQFGSPRPPSRPAGMCDLVVRDVFCRNGGLYATFANQGQGCTAADFVVRWSLSADNYRDSNSNYRYCQPPPGGQETTGSLGVNLLGMKPGQSYEVTCEVDPEHRVRESDRSNNRLVKRIVVEPFSNF